MSVTRMSAGLAGAAMLAVILLAAGNPERRKKRLAVLDFEYGTVRSEVSQMFGSDLDVGRGMAALLVKHLVRDGTYTIIEPRLVQMSVLQVGPSGEWRTDLAEAARVGRLLGVDAIVVGTILQFGAPHKASSGGGAVEPVGGAFGGKRSRKAVVVLNARLVDIESGEVVAVADATGQSMRESKSFAAFGAGDAGGLAFGGADFTTTGFLSTIIGEATEASIAGLSRELISANSALKARRSGVDGLIAEVKGSAVVLNVGSKAGLRAGDVLVVERVADLVRNPGAGGAARRATAKVGEVRVTQTDEMSSEGEVIGETEVRVGDTVRRGGT